MAQHGIVDGLLQLKGAGGRTEQRDAETLFADVRESKASTRFMSPRTPFGYREVCYKGLASVFFSLFTVADLVPVSSC
ncbi:hypothetical protein KG088_17315 [Halomonas sp. TRM85114]|uniref:hypothetical protein n=1 Tax=Halomonas jincaotanensis TaxID=2810616 RepID=UPI001BD32298|nr:hypothetical protein [Halomonas jincaotanensis]MBS9405373.1 hypothetical protein [Halomonas jincaotanensis]